MNHIESSQPKGTAQASPAVGVYSFTGTVAGLRYALQMEAWREVAVGTIDRIANFWTDPEVIKSIAQPYQEDL